MRLNLVTTADIARECQASRSRINYIVMSRSIEPAARAGAVRLYRPAAIERVREVLAAQDARRRAKFATA